MFNSPGLFFKNSSSATPVVPISTDFIMRINTGLGTGVNSFTLPLVTGGVYDFTVFWNIDDDSISSYVDSEGSSAKAHDYGAPFTGDIIIRGVCKGFSFGFGSNPLQRLKAIEVKQCGNIEIGGAGSAAGYFSACANLTWTATDALILPVDMEQAFYSTTSMTTNTSLNISDWSLVTTAVRCFAASHINQNLVLNTSSCIDFTEFAANSRLNGTVTGINTNSAQYLTGMFKQTSFFNQPTGSLIKSNVTDVTSMHEDASAFTEDTYTNSDISNLLLADNFITGFNPYPTSSYDALLNNWAFTQLSKQFNVTLGMGSTQYSIFGQAAHDELINNYGWTINDGGMV